MSGIEVSVAGRAEKAVIANLMQLYVHDFSEFYPGRADCDLDSEGRFPLPRLGSYWDDLGRVPLVFRLDGRPAGFALLDTVAHSGRAVDHNMAEFFVVRKHRLSGVGRAAVGTIFVRYPGRWEVAVARPNTGALAFWRRAIGGHPLVEALDEGDLSPPAWDGPFFTFRVRQAEPVGARPPR